MHMHMHMHKQTHMTTNAIEGVVCITERWLLKYRFCLQNRLKPCNHLSPIRDRKSGHWEPPSCLLVCASRLLRLLRSSNPRRKGARHPRKHLHPQENEKECLQSSRRSISDVTSVNNQESCVLEYGGAVSKPDKMKLLGTRHSGKHKKLDGFAALAYKVHLLRRIPCL